MVKRPPIIALKPPSAMAEETARQIAALRLDPARPLYVTDADEVIVSFARPLEEFLGKQGMRLELRDYRLVGNVHYVSTGEAVERETLFRLIDDFFAAEVDRQPLVAGAAEALATLGQTGQVVILTNVPGAYRQRRSDAFRQLGIHAPVIANNGLKGVPVQALADRVKAPVVFIDDIELHIRAVADSVPHSYRIHFIADTRLAAVTPQAPMSHHRASDWSDILDAIGRHLAAASPSTKL